MDIEHKEKRPPSAFILFCKAFQAKRLKEIKGERGVNEGEAFVIFKQEFGTSQALHCYMAKLWKEMSPEEKELFNRKAADLNREFEKRDPYYGSKYPPIRKLMSDSDFEEVAYRAVGPVSNLGLPLQYLELSVSRCSAQAPQQATVQTIPPVMYKPEGITQERFLGRLSNVNPDIKKRLDRYECDIKKMYYDFAKFILDNKNDGGFITKLLNDKYISRISNLCNSEVPNSCEESKKCFVKVINSIPKLSSAVIKYDQEVAQNGVQNGVQL